MAGFMETLRDRAGRQIVVNVQALKGGRSLSVEERAKRVWDIPAKLKVADRIRAEEEARAWREAEAAGAGRPHNNRFDAMRHARASQRIADAAGPIFAEVGGTTHEVENVFNQLIPAFRRHGLAGPYEADKGARPGEVVDEIKMDLHNNAEGRAAAREGRPVDPRRLKTEPSQSVPSALYRPPPDGLTGLPPR